MDTRCLAWNVKDDIMGSFPGGPKYYLPYRCHETQVAGQDICAKCLQKRELPRSNKNHPARWWGLITEPIGNFGDQISHIAFSPWFLEWAKKKPLPEESMVRAKKSIDRAREGIPNAPPLPTIQITEPTEAVLIEKKKPRIVKKLEKPAEVKQEEQKMKKPRKPKIATVEQKVVSEIKAVLSEEPPVEVEDVIEVEVKPFEHLGNLYYIDSKKYKLYDRQKDGGCKGIYMGRWDREAEKILKDEDSDREFP